MAVRALLRQHPGLAGANRMVPMLAEHPANQVPHPIRARDRSDAENLDGAAAAPPDDQYFALALADGDGELDDNVAAAVAVAAADPNRAYSNDSTTLSGGVANTSPERPTPLSFLGSRGLLPVRWFAMSSLWSVIISWSIGDSKFQR